MTAKIIYYLLINPASRLPMWFLYSLGHIFFFLIYYVFGYRKSVVWQNLSRALPNISVAERKQIMLRYYKHLADLLAEGVKGYTISKKQLLQQFQFTNPEVMEELYRQGKSVLLVGSHYNNWEFLVLSLDLQFSHKGTGVGQHISSKSVRQMMDKVRGRFGMEVWSSENVREKIAQYQHENRLFACLLLADQNPADPDRAFWMQFLNQPTPVIYGPEYLARKFDLPVVYYHVKKMKRGHYEATIEPITYTPLQEPEGEITYRHARLLEQHILAQPEFWLWSHKRWKKAHLHTGRQIRQ